jgi:hypothetical protein
MIVTTKNRPYLEKFFKTNIPKSYLCVIDNYIKKSIAKKILLPTYVLQGILRSEGKKNFDLKKSNFSNKFFWDGIPILFANNPKSYEIKDRIKRKRKKKEKKEK